MTIPGASEKIPGQFWDKGGHVFNVMHPDFGGVQNTSTRWNTTADAVSASATSTTTAANAAIVAALVNGGTVVFPPGQYYLNSQCLVTYSTNYVNVNIEGYGAELFFGSSVTGSCIKVVGAAQPHGITIRGLKANHRNNVNAAAFIELNGSSHGVIEDITIEHHNTKAGYAGVLLSSITPGTDDTASFWTTIRKLRMRQRSGGDGTNAPYGVLLQGAANATNIERCSLSHCVVGVGLVTDGVGTTLANAVLIDGNAFEGVTTGVKSVATHTTGLHPTGLRLTGNRCESATTFFEIATDNGVAALNHSCPPNLYGNYCTNGSVTNWVLNATGAQIQCTDPVYTGVNAGIRMQTVDDIQFISSGAKNVIIADASGNGGTWSSPHFQMGTDGSSTAGSHLWVNASDTAWYVKTSATRPTSATDGTIIVKPGAVLPGVGFAGRWLTPTYSASITPNAAAAGCQITVTNGTAFAINAPTSPTTDQPLTVLIKNTSGGAVGVITWDAVFKMATFTSPATGFSRSITFRYNATNWVEISRTPADVPN